MKLPGWNTSTQVFAVPLQWSVPSQAPPEDVPLQVVTAVAKASARLDKARRSVPNSVMWLPSGRSVRILVAPDYVAASGFLGGIASTHCALVLVHRRGAADEAFQSKKSLRLSGI